MSLLDTLGRESGTDKASGSHNYLNFYDLFLRHITRNRCSILELGVGGGHSLRMWKAYFPLGQITGFDIDPERERQAEERINIVIGDQANENDLDRVVDQYGPFDFINDDAGHDPSAQQFSFKYLFPHLKPHGYYMLEDIGDSGVTGYFLQLARDAVHNGSNEQLSPLCESVSFYREAIVIRRKA